MTVPVFKIKKMMDENKVRVFSSNYTLYGDMSKSI
jgi:DNA polymerase V